MNRRAWALVALLLVAGCAGGAAGGDDSSSGTPTTGTNTPTPTGTSPYGGYVSLSRIRIETPATGGGTDSAAASAAFNEPISLGAFPTPALDACTVTTPGPTPTPATYTSRDAGADVQVSGAASLDLPRGVNGAFIYYQTTASTSEIVPGGVYSVAWPGAAGGVEAESWSNAVTMPASLSITSPSLTSTVTVGSSALPMSWTGSSSVPVTIMLTIVETGTSNYTSISCRAADDGSFTIPASAISQLPSGTGTLGMYRATNSSRNLTDGSVVYLSGYWEHFGQVAK